MKLRHLQLLCRLADCGLSVSAAAHAMHTTQPNVTRHLQALEKELGISLFARSKRRILGFTDAGREALQSARRVLREVDNLGAIGTKNAKELSGTMTIAASHTQARYALPKVVQAFIVHYPKVRIVLRQGDPKQILSWVSSGHADVAICTQPSVWPKNLAFFSCGRHSRIILAPRAHPLTALRKPTLAQLARYPLITYDDSFGVHSRIVEAFESRGFAPNIVLTATDVDVMKTYVRCGLGVALVAALAFDAKEDLELRAISAHHLFDPALIKVVLRKGTHVRPYVYDFIQRLSPSLKSERIEAVLSS